MSFYSTHTARLAPLYDAIPFERIHITLRDGPVEPERGVHDVPDAEMEALARENRSGTEKLGFAKEDFNALMALLSEKGLRIGTPISTKVAPILHRALKLAADVITKMPAHYTTYASGDPIFKVKTAPRRAGQLPTSITVEYLSGFGEFHIPQWNSSNRSNRFIACGPESADSLKSRFWHEANTTLPGSNQSLPDVLDAMQLQRVQLPREW